MRRFFLPLAWLACALIPACTHAQALPDAPGAVAAQRDAAGPLTLQDALSLAAAGNFSLSAAAREIDAQEGAVMQSRVIPNPEFAAIVEDTHKETRATTGQFNIPVELGGKRAARINAAERGREVAQAQFNTLRADLRATVIEAFFGVLIAQERVRLATGSADIATRGAQAAARRVAAGKIPPVDETKARVEQANAELEVAEATSDLLSARQALATLWGNPSPRFAEAVGDMETLPTRPAPALLLAELENAPSLIANRLELERRQALIGVERSRQYPDVTLSLGAKRENDANRNMAVLGVAIPLPLFDRNQGNLYEAIRRADKAQDEFLGSQIRLSNALQQASNQLAASRASAQTLRTTVLPGAEQAYDVANRGFEAGKFSFLDVLDAQRTLFQARIRYLSVLARTYQSATNIDRILGR